MGGVKRKISTDKKIEKKESKSVAFSKRRSGLYSKASQLCVLSGAQVAILATPPCSKSNVSFYSFGHSSVDSVVSAFLENQCPREDHLGGSEYWWEDERLAESEDPNELSDAVDSISRMLQNLKGTLRSKALANREDAKKIKKKEVVDQSQTLNLQSACASSSCIHEDPPENHQGLVKNFKEEDQIAEDNRDVVIQETHQEPDGNQTLGFQSCFPSLFIQDVSPENVEVSVNNSEQKDQIVASSDTSYNNDGLLENLDGFDQVLTLDDDDFIDFEMNSEGFITTKLEMDNVSTSRSCTGSQGAEDGTMVVVHSNSKKDNQMVAVSDSNNAIPGDVYGCNQEFDIDQIFDLVTSTDDLSMNSEMIDDVSMMMNTDKNHNWCSNSEAVERGAVALHRDLEQDNVSTSRSCTGSEGAEDVAMVVVHCNSKKDNPMVAVSDSNNAQPGEVYGCNQEFDIDQIFDLVTSTEDLSRNSEKMDDVSMMMNKSKNQNGCSDSEAAEHGAVALHRDLEQDNLHFSDFFKGLFLQDDMTM